MTLNDIHKRFFCFRNGIVAKAFSDAGAPYKRVFGLQVPQLGAIGRECGYDPELASQLWAEKECREARLLACWLFDPSVLPEEEALRMAEDVQTREEADILAWRLLSRLPYASALLPRLNGYIAEALTRNLTPKPIAREEEGAGIEDSGSEFSACRR